MRTLSMFLTLAIGGTAPLLAAQTLAVPAFDSVELRGGGNLVIHPGPAQRVTLVSGSTEFTRMRVEGDGKLVIEACTDRCPRNYDLRIDIASPNVPDAAIAGGGNIDVARGFAAQRDLAVAVKGGGTIDARTVTATDVSAAVNGGGTIFAGPSRTLSAAVRGGGDVRYSGNPEVTSAVAGGGSVERIR